MRPNLRIIFLITLISLPYVVASPVYAFWFFKHKQSNQNSQNLNQNNPINYPSPYPINQSAAGSSGRLVPSYLINNKIVTPVQVRQAESIQQSTSISGQQIKQNSPNNQYKPILNTIPITPLFSYSKTNIRIAIGLNLQSAKLAILDGAELIDNSTGETITNLPAQSEWILSIQNNHLSLEPDRDFYLALNKLANANNLAGGTALKNSTIPASYASSSAINITGKNFATIQSRVNSDANHLSLIINGSGYTIKTITNQQSQQGLLALNNRLYHGDFLIKLNKGENKANSSDHFMASFNIINYLDLEDYLLSVVPSEMPSLWPIEALKAQAIAARSYALANLGKHGSAGYDLKDNIEDQAYLGVKSETDSTNEAVNSTKGLVMKYDGKPICAYFHSCSGGSTEKAEHVWHSSVPYLKAVIDFDQEAPLYNWTKNYSILQTESGLPKDIGPILSITILARSPSGRVTHILVNGLNNSRIISGEAARKYFNLPSTNFNVTPSDTTYVFAGKGFGHGLGLSQWGAKYLAKHGYNAAQILCYYYDGIAIDY